MWKIFEKRLFFRADMAGLGKYCTGGYGQIGVFRVKEKRLVDWFDHISGYLNNQSKFNILMVKYEDLKNDLKVNIRRVSGGRAE